MRKDVRRRGGEPPVGGRENVQIASNDAHEKRIGHVLAAQNALVGGENVIGVQHDAHAGRLQRCLDEHLSYTYDCHHFGLFAPFDLCGNLLPLRGIGH